MKKVLLLLLGIFMLSNVLVQAQEDTRPTILVAKFGGNKDFKQAYIDQVRSKVLEGITKTQRFRVIDGLSDAAFQNEATRRMAESAMTDETARTQLMQTLGAQYIVTGAVTTLSSVQGKLDDGSIYYTGNIAYTINLLDAATGTAKASETFNHNGLTADDGDSEVEAVNKTCERIVKDVTTFIDKNVKLSSKIVQIDEVKKDKAATVYIDLGEESGIQKGQKFEVFKEVMVGTRVTTKKIGELTAVEVSEGATLCKVNDGGDVINTLFNEGATLSVKTRAKKEGFLNKAIKVIN